MLDFGCLSPLFGLGLVLPYVDHCNGTASALIFLLLILGII
ncbi:Uncharacterised protein [Serratia fonticola]|jgi:hypothetical protein|nr:Uncharacterised protein [Serratia fonticola]